MADGDLKTEISRNESANTASNVVFTQIADDAGNVAGVTGSALDVNATVTGIETAYVDDSAFTIATDKVNAQGFLADETATDSVDEGDIGLARMTLDRRMIVAADQRGTWTVDLGATDNAVLDAIAASLVDIETNTDYGTVIGGGAEATALRVTIANDSTGLLSIDDNGGSITVDGTVATTPSNAAEGTAIADYDVSAATAQSATDNHDYTVANTTFYLKKVIISGSGRMKAEIQTGPVASLATRAVIFKKRDETERATFDPAFPVPATSTGTVRVIRTQRSSGSLFMYSTIEGDDV
jgi:hypothetical protein